LRAGLIGEVAESTQSRDGFAMSDCDGSRRECMGCDGFLKDRKCALESRVLVSDSQQRDASLPEQ